MFQTHLLGQDPFYEVRGAQCTVDWTLCVGGYRDVYIYMLMRDEEGRKKEARKVKQITTQHTQGSHFSKGKVTCLGWNSNPRHSTL